MLRKILSLVLALGLLFQQVGYAAIAELNIAAALSAMKPYAPADIFRPIHMRYFSYDLQSNNFKMYLDKGDIKDLAGDKLKNQGQELLRYFLIGISLPDDRFWVNLRPDAEDQIIDPQLACTDIGKVLLEADLQLKKDTASFTSPQTPEGRAYWDKLYKRANELFGNDNVTIPTLTRPWIVPGEIIIRETKDSGYIYKANLKVMLEADYLQGTRDKGQGTNIYQFNDPRLKALNDYSTEIIRETIIPKLTKEVNTSKRYAALRQVYYSLVLARWFKARFQNQGLSLKRTVPDFVNRINSLNLANLTSTQSWSKSIYFNAYKESFAKGEYNIKEPERTPYGQVIRSYFSGGIAMGPEAMKMPGQSVDGAPGTGVVLSQRETPLPAGGVTLTGQGDGDIIVDSDFSHPDQLRRTEKYNEVWNREVGRLHQRAKEGGYSFSLTALEEHKIDQMALSAASDWSSGKPATIQGMMDSDADLLLREKVRLFDEAKRDHPYLDQEIFATEFIKIHNEAVEAQRATSPTGEVRISLEQEAGFIARAMSRASRYGNRYYYVWDQERRKYVFDARGRIPDRDSDSNDLTFDQRFTTGVKVYSAAELAQGEEYIGNQALRPISQAHLTDTEQIVWDNILGIFSKVFARSAAFNTGATFRGSFRLFEADENSTVFVRRIGERSIFYVNRKWLTTLANLQKQAIGADAFLSLLAPDMQSAVRPAILEQAKAGLSPLVSSEIFAIAFHEIGGHHWAGQTKSAAPDFQLTTVAEGELQAFRGGAAFNELNLSVHKFVLQCMGISTANLDDGIAQAGINRQKLDGLVASFSGLVSAQPVAPAQAEPAPATAGMRLKDTWRLLYKGIRHDERFGFGMSEFGEAYRIWAKDLGFSDLSENWEDTVKENLDTLAEWGVLTKTSGGGYKVTTQGHFLLKIDAGVELGKWSLASPGIEHNDRLLELAEKFGGVFNELEAYRFLLTCEPVSMEAVEHSLKNFLNVLSDITLTRVEKEYLINNRIARVRESLKEKKSSVQKGESQEYYLGLLARLDQALDQIVAIINVPAAPARAVAFATGQGDGRMSFDGPGAAAVDSPDFAKTPAYADRFVLNRSESYGSKGNSYELIFANTNMYAGELLVVWHREDNCTHITWSSNAGDTKNLSVPNGWHNFHWYEALDMLYPARGEGVGTQNLSTPASPGAIDHSKGPVASGIPENKPVAPANAGGIDGSAPRQGSGQVSSPSIPGTKALGGIDFRTMNLITQPMGTCAGLNYKLPLVKNAGAMDLDQELGMIKKMVVLGIMPSPERLKEFMSACYQRKEFVSRRDDIISCLIEICRLSEINSEETSAQLRECLVMVDSEKLELAKL